VFLEENITSTTLFQIKNTGERDPISYKIQIFEPYSVRFAEVNHTLVVLLVSILLALILLIVIAYGMVWKISAPLKTLINIVNVYADGDYTPSRENVPFLEFQKFVAVLKTMGINIRKKIADLHKLNEVGEVLAGLHDEVEALVAAIKVLEERNHLSNGSIYLLNEQKELELHAAYPKSEEKVQKLPAKMFQMGEGIIGKALKEKHPVFIPDTSQSPDYLTDGEENETKALLCVPLYDDQAIFGVMNFSGNVGEVQFDADDIEFIETIARLTVSIQKIFKCYRPLKNIVGLWKKKSRGVPSNCRKRRMTSTPCCKTCNRESLLSFQMRRLFFQSSILNIHSI